MKKITILLAALAVLWSCSNANNTKTEECACDAPGFVLTDDMVEVKVENQFELLNIHTMFQWVIQQ